MSGSNRIPKNESISRYNRRVYYDDKKFHKILKTALIPPEALKEIEKLSEELKEALSKEP